MLKPCGGDTAMRPLLKLKRNIMKKLLLFTLMAAASATAGAQNKMIVRQAETGAESSFTLAGIRKLTFADGAMTVTTKAGAAEQTQAFELAKVSRVTFGGDATAIDKIKASAVRGTFAYDGTTVRVAGLAKPATATIYSASGAAVARVAQWDGSGLNVSALAPGVYMLNVGGQSYKFIK